MLHYPEYIVYLKNGKKLRFWFKGSQIEKLLKDYDIPYEKKIKKQMLLEKEKNEIQWEKIN